MSSEFPDVWQFGEFRLDVRRKVLSQGEHSVAMPLKQLEVLSMLVRNRGELVTKEEILDEIWEDSFVEESNLSRHIYLLRKTLKDLGADGLIENVPRRGYRFTGEAREVEAEQVVLEKHTRTRTLIEIQDETRSTRSYLRPMTLAAIGVFLVGVSVVAALVYVGSEQSAPPIRSMAVMPFKTLSSDPNASQMGGGLADILTTRLSNIRELRVRPSNAVAVPENEDAVTAGNRLQVDGILEGTIYHLGERVRVTARLIRVSDASIVWTGEFEKLKRDELQLQNDLALQIVPALRLNLSSGERDALAKRYTESSDAYELYLKGRYEWNKRSMPGMVEAQRLFRNAIAADPSFALAYVGLADTLLMHQPMAHEAFAAVSRALELDPSLGEAHASLGFYLMFYEWNWKRADAEFRLAVELNPSYPTAHHWYATLLAIKGQLEPAKSEMHKALELNPTSANFLADLGQLYYFSGDYVEAERYCLRALEVDHDFMLGHEYLYYVYLKTGKYENAVTEIAKADEINGAFTIDRGKKSEQVDRHSRVFRETGLTGYLEFRFPGTPTAPETFYLYAAKHALLGETDKALDYLEKSTNARMFLSAFLKADPVFEPLRSEPRYKEILRKMGLAETSG